MVYPIARLFFPLIRMLFVKECDGLENIPSKGPFIVAANHQSHLDGYLIACYVIQRTNQKIHFFAKREVTGYFGAIIEKLVYQKFTGALLIEKQGTRNKGEEAIKSAGHLLDCGEIVGIFPEGTRTYDGSLLDGRTGIIRIVLHTKKGRKIPVIPVGIKNAHEMLPRNAIVPRIWKARAIISFGKPFYLNSCININKQNNPATKKLLRSATTFVMKKISKQAGASYGYK